MPVAVPSIKLPVPRAGTQASMMSPLPEISQQHSNHSVHACMAVDKAFTRSRPPTGMAPKLSLVPPAPIHPIDSISVSGVCMAMPKKAVRRQARRTFVLDPASCDSQRTRKPKNSDPSSSRTCPAFSLQQADTIGACFKAYLQPGTAVALLQHSKACRKGRCLVQCRNTNLSHSARPLLQTACSMCLHSSLSAPKKQGMSNRSHQNSSPSHTAPPVIDLQCCLTKARCEPAAAKCLQHVSACLPSQYPREKA
jgi:hypothetical protein